MQWGHSLGLQHPDKAVNWVHIEQEEYIFHLRIPFDDSLDILLAVEIARASSTDLLIVHDYFAG
jgi:hypothetical protein